MENEEIVPVDTTNNETEGSEAKEETVSLSKTEYEKLNQTLGSLKRELKDLKKPKEETVKESSKADTAPLLEKIERMTLRQAGLTESEDIELARNTAKKWGIDIDEVLLDEDFKLKLERQQANRANAIATSRIKGGAGTSQAKNTPEYWQAKGVPPSPSDVPDRAIRAKIVRSMMESAKVGKKFYNE
jgi:hypothetical protein